jgi:hypothetical protein
LPPLIRGGWSEVGAAIEGLLTCRHKRGYR